MSTVTGRYAKALLDLAISGHAVDEYRDELEAVSRIVKAESGLNAFLLSPRKDLIAKKNMLAHVFGGSIRKNILNFLFLLLEKGRMESLPGIYSDYAEMSDTYRNIITVSVTTALPLSRAQTDSIGEKFRALYHGSSVKITVETDPSLIGGVKVAVGDRLYDGTVKGKLKKMRAALAGE